MPLEISFQLSLFGRTLPERWYQMTGWIFLPSSGLSGRTPKFQCLPLDDGDTPEWYEGDAPIWPGGPWTPNTGQAPAWHGGSASSSWRILEGGVLEKYCLSPAQCSRFLRLAQRAGCPPPREIEALFLKQGGRVPIVRPFQLFRMRGAAKNQEHIQFRDSFGFPTDPFPTLLASDVAPFAFWYEDDPLGGCVRFPTELECERMMGLPEGWTQYGADGEPIRPIHRYRALGNAIALPCADYIMAGIAEVLNHVEK